MATFHVQYFKCSLCRKEFKDDVVLSSNTIAAQDADFRTYSPGTQTIPSMVHTCPYCGFTDYLHEQELENGEREKINEYLDSYCSYRRPGNFSPTEKHELLVKIFILRDKPSMEIAQAYLNAAWLAEDEKNIEQGHEFRKYAKDFLIKALENHEVEKEKAPVITYLVGELNRRLENFNEALEWFSRVKSKDSRLTKLCKQQTFLASIEKSVNARISD